MRGPIVVGTDGSDASRHALFEAGALAKETGRRVVLVVVRRLKQQGTAGVFAPGAIGPLQENLAAVQTLAQAQGIAVLDGLGVPWTFEVRCGQPAAELMKSATAHDAEIIVVAGRRRGTIGSIAGASSVTAQLLHHWPYSLLVVRGG